MLILKEHIIYLCNNHITSTRLWRMLNKYNQLDQGIARVLIVSLSVH